MKKTKEEYEKEKAALEKKLERIKNKIEILNKPKPIGFLYKGKK